ncbi:MAG: PEP-CTERM sorting domain-containing protein [Rubrivivax sp.]
MRPILAGLLLGLSTAAVVPAHAQTLGAEFATNYSIFDLGSITGLPSNYGGLAFINANTLLIGGAANSAAGSLYTIGVTRNANGFVSGFSGTAQRYGGAGGTIGEFNDGGVVFGPGGVLFTARWPSNELGQTLPGATDESRVTNLAPMGVTSSLSAINFVPAGFGGAGQIKLVSYGGGQWYSAGLSPDGNGTFDLVGLNQVDLDPLAAGIQNVPGGPEGFVYIAAGSSAFASNSMLISEYASGLVGAYQVDANGNPLVATRRTFLSGLSGAEGAVIDPVTGDFLFSTFGGGSRVVRVTGFAPPVPEPSTWLLMVLGIAALGATAAKPRARPSQA